MYCYRLWKGIIIHNLLHLLNIFVFQECKNKPSLQRHYALGHGIMFRSGSPRPLSKPRNTFSLFATPLTRIVRPLCPIRRLARGALYSIDINDIRTQWETRVNEKPTEDIRSICTNLQKSYKKSNERYKINHLNNLFELKNENDLTKTFSDHFGKFEEKKFNENEINLPIRYPKLQEDLSDFYTQFTHNNMSIMKKRPYESNENSNESKRKQIFIKTKR
jgi:hypothetical protein